MASQAVDEVVVIDALTSELSSRMRDAAIRVERLNDVARALDELVGGVRPSRNGDSPRDRAKAATRFGRTLFIAGALRGVSVACLDFW